MKNISRVAAVIAKAREELAQLQKEDGVSFYTEAISKNIQIGTYQFMKSFSKEDMKITNRNSIDYPYEVTSQLEDLSIYTLLDRSEYKVHFPERQTKEERRIAELEAKLAELQGGENL